MYQKAEKVIRVTGGYVYKVYSLISHFAIDARKQNFVRKIDRLEEALSKDVIKTDSQSENKDGKTSRDDQVKKLIKDGYIQGYVKGWSELRHRYILGMITGIFIGYVSYRLKESIDQLNRNNKYDRDISNLHSEIILIESDTMRMTTRLDLTGELDRNNEQKQLQKSELIRQHQDHLAHLNRIENELKMLSEQLKSFNIDKNIKKIINTKMQHVTNSLEDTRCFLSTNILILIDDLDRALLNLRTYLVRRANLAGDTRTQDLYKLIESHCSASINTKSKPDPGQLDYFDICIALTSFIYLIMQKKYRDGDYIYSFFSGSKIKESPFQLINQLARIYGLNNLSQINSLSTYSVALRALHHNIIYSQIIEDEKLHLADPDNKILSNVTPALEKALKLNIDGWVDNPQPMPYFSFFKLKQLQCRQLKVKGLDTASCDSEAIEYRHMAEMLRDQGVASKI